MYNKNSSTKPWDNAPVPNGYTLTEHGLFKASEENENEAFVASPVWVEAITTDASTNQYGMLIGWLDLKNIVQQKPFDKGLLHDRGNKLVTILSNQGVHIPHGKARALMEYLGLASYLNDNFIQSVSSLGWLISANGQENRLAYVLPPDLVIGESSEKVVFKPVSYSPTTNTIKTSGTLEQWQTSVVQACNGNPFLVFALCTGFAAPLLKLANLESGGFHFYGHSSRGKTTMAQVAASVFGCGADPAENSEKAFIQRWNSTSNALEGLAASHNHGLLVLSTSPLVTQF